MRFGCVRHGHPVHLPQKLDHKRCRRLLVDLVGSPDLLDAPAIRHDDPVGDLQRLLLVVGDEHAGHTHLVVQPPQPSAQLQAHPRVECAEGFVQQQHTWLDRERTRERDALPLPARELMRIAFRKPVELNEIEQLVDPIANRRFAHPLRARTDTEAKRDVLEDRHVAEERVVLEHEADLPFTRMRVRRIFAVEADRAGIRYLQPRDDAQQRRLARTGGPEKCDELAGRNLQVDMVDRRETAEALDHAGQLNAHVGLSPAQWTSLRVCRSTTNFNPSVTSASSASSEATANAAAN